ncbi:hypothetical protein [Cryobacterium luteum]|uniref:hypothetical protein n=1 Tax=Cryobacterium luteum TaxID=1424661 RepID=UPI00106A6041|nr:hypothetical protein [Cryobacterium luteum]
MTGANVSELGIDLDAAGGFGLTGAGALGLIWVVGPSVKALGKNLGQWTDYQTANLLRLSGKVRERIGDAAPNDGDSIHPRIVKEVLESASWIDDDLHQEYLAGLLVSSRSPGGRDDSGAYLTRLVAGLSAAQIRIHYAMYSAYLNSRDMTDDGPPRFTHVAELTQMVVIATTESMMLVASGGAERSKGAALYGATSGLQREGLIAGAGYPMNGTVRSQYQLVPTMLGASVFGQSMFTSPLEGARIATRTETLMRGATPHIFQAQEPLNGYRFAEVRISVGG